MNKDNYEIQEITNSEKKKEDYLFKVVILGDCAVGKSNILSRIMKNEFSKASKSTISVELSSKYFKIDNKIVKINLWDTAGQERYASVTGTYYKGAKGVFIVYDMTRRETFNNVDKWYKEVKMLNNEDIIFFLIGNKSDLSLLKEISIDEGKKKANIYKMIFYETSALDSTNIKISFQDMILRLYKSAKFGYIKDNKSASFPIKEDNFQNNNNNNCNC